MFDKRIRPNQFDYEPIYYNPSKDKRRHLADEPPATEEAQDGRKSRFKFRHLPKLSPARTRYSLLTLVVLLSLLVYVFMWFHRFENKPLPQFTPTESPAR